MTTFVDRLFSAIQKGESVYESFFRICRECLPFDADTRYQWLKVNGYIARDEADIRVYVARVAAKHRARFKWLYDNLFVRFPYVFQNEVDLVVWGCGCGLDLLALYDRAMQQDNPQLWLTLRSVTLIDKSKVALKWAKEIAEVLFPVTKSKIVTRVCDFKSEERLQLQIPPSFVYTPRLHLVSNVIDLLSADQLKLFANTQKDVCARTLHGKKWFNDMFVSFSPEYRNYDWVSTKSKMDSYRDAWGENATDIVVGGGDPDLCAYTTFTLNNFKNSLPYKTYVSGNRCLRNLVRCRNRCLDEGCDDYVFRGLHKVLYDVHIGDRNFFDCYEWVDIQTWKDKHGQVHIDRILFVPNDNTNICPCVIYFQQPNGDIDVKKKAWEWCLKKSGLESSNIYDLVSVTKKLLWQNRELIGDDFNTFILKRPYNFSDAFVINPRGASPLPDLEKEMDSKQRNIIFGRVQLRRIRGGAGCGKTTTMLWHGVMSILRMHQPVLMACRTVTLFNHNQRRMAATLLSKISGLEYVERDLIQFRTIDKYLCEHIDRLNSCRIRHCGMCKRRFFQKYSKAISAESLVPKACKEGAARLPNCSVLLNWENAPDSIDQNLTKEEKDALCDNCKEDAVKALCDKNEMYLSGAEVLGAVMVDEIQSVEPEKVQALYNLTEAGNSHREFYCFCDERQSLKAKSLESDVETGGKWRVKTPSAGPGKRFNQTWITMQKPYRQIGDMSGVLNEVAHEFQKLLDAKYGKNETEQRPYQLNLVNVFSVERSATEGLKESIYRVIKQLQQSGEKRITVICEKPEIVRKLLCVPHNPSWLSTHAIVENFKEEQKLRSNFDESEDHIGLTTIELAQGWDLENVILIVDNDKTQNPHELESVTTGITRAKRQLRIIDTSPSGWVYDILKKFNQ